MFATVVRLMTEVVLGVSRSIRAAYQDAEETVPVSIASGLQQTQRHRAASVG